MAFSMKIDREMRAERKKRVEDNVRLKLLFTKLTSNLGLRSILPK
jgi:hypothetical protein